MAREENDLPEATTDTSFPVERVHPEALTEALEAAYTVDVGEASQVLGVSLARLSQLTTKGTLSHVRKRVGARWRIFYRKEEIDELARLHRATHFPRTLVAYAPAPSTGPVPATAADRTVASGAGQGNTGAQPSADTPFRARDEDASDPLLAGLGRGEARWLYGPAEERPGAAHVTWFSAPVSDFNSVWTTGYGAHRRQSAVDIQDSLERSRTEAELQGRLASLHSSVEQALGKLAALESGAHAIGSRATHFDLPSRPAAAPLPSALTPASLAKLDAAFETLQSLVGLEDRILSALAEHQEAAPGKGDGRSEAPRGERKKRPGRHTRRRGTKAFRFIK